MKTNELYDLNNQNCLFSEFDFDGDSATLTYMSRREYPCVDLFQWLPKQILKKLKYTNSLFIFDSILEAFNHEQHWECLRYTCGIHGVNNQQIVYATSNTLAKAQHAEWCNTTGCEPFHVLEIPFWEINQSRIAYNLAGKKVLSASAKLNLVRQTCNKHHKEIYFSSLCKTSRPHRSAAQFMLCQTAIANRALISHPKIKMQDLTESIDGLKQIGYKHKQIRRWVKATPFAIDYNDFSTSNWLARPYNKLFDQTLFHITNETQVDHAWQGYRSQFFTEKTFRSMLEMQPFVIYGTPGINQHLKDIGYMTYEDWFDYSFDNEPNPFLRYKMLLNTVEKTCAYLETLSQKDRVAWRFKNTKVLEHNYTRATYARTCTEELNRFFKTDWSIF